VRGKRGRPRRRPDVMLGDRGYDHDKYRRLVWDLGVKPVIARRGTEHGSGLGTQRWVVERPFAHLHWFRRLRIRWEIRDDIHEAFLTLGCDTHLLATPELTPIRSFETACAAAEILLDRRTAVRGALPLCEEVVRPQRTAKEKSKEVTHSLPLSMYSAPGGLRQDPGRVAQSPAEARTCGNQGVAKYVCSCRRVGLAGRRTNGGTRGAVAHSARRCGVRAGLPGAAGRNATLLNGRFHD
jgi:transposase